MATILKKIKTLFGTIRWKLVSTYFVIILATLLVFSVYILNVLGDYMYNQRRVSALTNVNIISSYIGQNKDIDNLKEDLYLVINLLKQVSINYSKDMRLILVDTDAIVVYDSNRFSNLVGKALLEEQVLSALAGKSNYKKIVQDSGDVILSSAVPISGEGKTIGAVYTNESANDVEELLSHFRNNLISLSLILSFIVGIFSLVMANIITAPIVALMKNIKDRKAKEIPEPIEIKTRGEVKDLIDAINKMTEEMQDLEQRRSQFVSNASHELKTPLSSIKLVCDSILQIKGSDPELTEEFLKDMNNEVDRLTLIVNDLLDLTKMDAQRQKDVKEKFVTTNLRDIVSGVVASLRKLANKRNIKIELDTDNDVFMLMNGEKIWAAIYNIVDNSIKYSKDGGKVEVYLERDGTDAIVTIKDDGIGIPKEALPNLFDRFYRVDAARARDTGGTGLGLSISLAAVEMHGGHIEVQSEENVGSTFRIYLPIA